MSLFKARLIYEGVTDGYVATGKDFRSFNAHFKTLDTEEKYQNNIVMQCGEARAQILRNLAKGVVVDVLYSLASREWNGKFYNDINFVMLDNKANGQTAPAAPQTKTAPAPAAEAAPFIPEVGDNPADDLPF